MKNKEITTLLRLHSNDAFMGFYFHCLFKTFTTFRLSCFYFVQSLFKATPLCSKLHKLTITKQQNYETKKTREHLTPGLMF